MLYCVVIHEYSNIKRESEEFTGTLNEGGALTIFRWGVSGWVGISAPVKLLFSTLLSYFDIMNISLTTRPGHTFLIF